MRFQTVMQLYGLRVIFLSSSKGLKEGWYKSMVKHTAAITLYTALADAFTGQKRLRSGISHPNLLVIYLGTYLLTRLVSNLVIFLEMFWLFIRVMPWDWVLVRYFVRSIPPANALYPCRTHWNHFPTLYGVTPNVCNYLVDTITCVMTGKYLQPQLTFRFHWVNSTDVISAPDNASTVFTYEQLRKMLTLAQIANGRCDWLSWIEKCIDQFVECNTSSWYIGIRISHHDASLD